MTSYYYSNQGGGGGYKDDRRYYDDHAVAMPAQGVVMTTEKKPWNWCATVWASIACFLCPCCIICNFIAVMCLGHSYTDHKVGDNDRRKYKLNCGIGWMVTSWVLGICTLIVLIVVGVLIFNGTIEDLNGIYCQVIRSLGYQAGYQGNPC